MTLSPAMVKASRQLTRDLKDLTFAPPVTHVYNPLDYARNSHEQYLTRYADKPKKIIFLGMNPGPFGMAQTGVPFGEIPAVRDWMKIDGAVNKPADEHPKRPIDGFQCQRSEVSGRRLWGLFSERYPDPADFFQKHFVVNFCPLVFMEESGKNHTPDKLPKEKKAVIDEICLQHLGKVMKILEAEWLVGVGAYAEGCARELLKADPSLNFKIGKVLHPSPASPAANRGWAEQAEKQLKEQGIW